MADQDERQLEVVDSLVASPAAVAMTQALVAEHGPLAFFQSGGCCDGTAPICLCDGELLAGSNDVLLGSIAGAPFYIDRELYERWGRPRLLIDTVAGPAEGFSLSLPDAHFVTRAPAACTPELESVQDPTPVASFARRAPRPARSSLLS